MHAALEELFTVPAAQRTTDTASTLIAQHWDRMCVEAPEDAQILADGLALNEPTKVANAVFAPIQRLLDAYFTLEDPRRVEPHALEMGVSTELPSGLALRGIHRSGRRLPHGARASGGLQDGSQPWSRIRGEGLVSDALLRAAVVCGQLARSQRVLTCLYFGDGQRISYEPAEDELVATERKIMALSDAITRAATQGFPATPSALCGWCSFQDSCPEFGGQTPPMPAPTGVAHADHCHTTPLQRATTGADAAKHRATTPVAACSPACPRLGRLRHRCARLEEPQPPHTPR